MNVALLDNRIAYGARCTWWDGIRKVGKTAPGPSGHSLPCCPHCGGMLFEVENEGKWIAGMDRYEAAGHPGYRAMMDWARGKCFKNFSELQHAYEARYQFTEEACPGHVASDSDPKVCGRCGTHIDSLRPDDEQ